MILFGGFNSILINIHPYFTYQFLSEILFWVRIGNKHNGMNNFVKN